MQRLAIFLPVYAFVAIFLPRNPAVQRMLEPLYAVPPSVTFPISLIALIVAGIVLYLFRKQPGGWLYTKPVWWMRVADSGLIGVAIAGLFDVFEKLAGGPTSLFSIIVVPIAFMIAEAVTLAVERRMNRDRL